MKPEEIRDLVVETLDQAKGNDIRVLDVRGLTDICDYMVVVSGTSDRHVKSLADKVVGAMRDRGKRPLSGEGADQGGEWILLDFGDVVVHVMLPQARTFYDLEKLWDEDMRALIEAQREQNAD
jgi:ribosome-associated protein